MMGTRGNNVVGNALELVVRNMMASTMSLMEIETREPQGQNNEYCNISDFIAHYVFSQYSLQAYIIIYLLNVISV